MKLVYRILLHMSWALSLLLAAWAVLFYFTMIDEINDEVDDALEARAEVIVKRVLAGRELPVPADEGNNGYFLHEVSPQYAAAQHHERYSDEEIFIPERDDKEPARVLRKVFRDGAGQWRELTVMTPTIEKDDLRESILRWMVCLYLFLLLMILLVTVIVLYRTMRPLYALLRWLDGYTVGARNAPLAVETSVTEFRKLNDAARRYAERAESSFERQKQFIGNASHEMQTPLAVCRNRLEMLVDDAHALTGEQLGEIAKVQRTLDYLVRLNRSLLLLSKIENGQFPESEPVDEPSAEMVAAQAAYEKSSEKTDFSKKMDSVWEYLKKLFRLSLDTKFIATRHDAIILNIPILIPIVALFAWGATIWLMLLGLFFGMRYRIDSDGDVPGSINNLMDHAADAADDIKQNLNDDK